MALCLFEPLILFFKILYLNRVIMDYNQKLVLIIAMYTYLRYFRSRKGKRKRDTTSAMSGHQFTLELL